jgi:hypothetical protein
MAETTMEPAVPPWTGSPEDLEQRLQRLEDLVAGICDTQILEERVRERVLEQLRAEMDALKAEREKKSAEPSAPEETPRPAGRPPVAAIAPSPPPTNSLIRELWWEANTFSQMLRDPFYRLSWAARLVLLVPIGYLLWSLIVGFPRGIPFIGFFLDLAIVYVIAYLVLKVFGRELRRYRDFTTRNPW